MPNYSKLYTPQDGAVVFIDHQPQMTFGVANIDRTLLKNKVTLLAKVANEFKVPAVLTAVETESFSGYVWPQLLDVFPGQTVIERSSMNSWGDAGFRKAIEATGRKNILLTGLWTEVCVTWPALQMRPSLGPSANENSRSHKTSENRPVGWNVHLSSRG
jgi:nicotinamidase-related amidase